MTRKCSHVTKNSGALWKTSAAVQPPRHLSFRAVRSVSENVRRNPLLCAARGTLTTCHPESLRFHQQAEGSRAHLHRSNHPVILSAADSFAPRMNPRSRRTPCIFPPPTALAGNSPGAFRVYIQLDRIVIPIVIARPREDLHRPHHLVLPSLNEGTPSGATRGEDARAPTLRCQARRSCFCIVGRRGLREGHGFSHAASARNLPHAPQGRQESYALGINVVALLYGFGSGLGFSFGLPGHRLLRTLSEAALSAEKSLLRITHSSHRTA